jgi:uncharacterized protein (TIGR00303 family)
LNIGKYSDIISINEGSHSIDSFSNKNTIFLCVISYTKTSELRGITVAGSKPNLIKYTPAADCEFLYYGECKCIDKVPATPDGKPTPAIITKAALHLADIPILVVSSGSKVKPLIPYLSFDLEPGRNILYEKAMEFKDAKRAFDYGEILGNQLAKNYGTVLIGESIPGGTTTALGVLIALGVDARFKVSSSMPNNPHAIKNKIIHQAMERENISFGELKNDPLMAVSIFGDPMLPAVAGIASGVINLGRRVILSGGTQMSAVVAILKLLSHDSLKKICVGTTSYVALDKSSSLKYLIKSISEDVPIYAADLHMEESNKIGLRAFSKGFVKEGVGAGGTSVAAMLNSRGKIDGRALLKAIELEYERHIEKKLISTTIKYEGDSIKL